MAKERFASGRLDGDHVVVDDAGVADRLHSRGALGNPQPGAPLQLSLVEAAWCLEAGRLQVDGPDGSVRGLLERGARSGERTEVDFLAYRDLRERGLVVRHDATPGQFLVWNRGEMPPARHSFLLRVAAEREPIAAATLLDLCKVRAVVAVVDEDGAVTHYNAALDVPAGSVAQGALPRAAGTVLDDRVLVDDAAAAKAYFHDEHLGTQVGTRLVLSLTEAEALRKRRILDVPELAAKARARQPAFDAILAAHEALRAAGVVAKSGFKFGTHLRGYRSDPGASHAEWLVQCVGPGQSLSWSDLSRAIRLSHGVRKRLLVAVAEPTGVKFANLAWFRP